MSNAGTALIVVLSEAHNDPRVRRQIDWLANAGWTVDTIGLGRLPSKSVRTHFELLPQAEWVRSKAGALIIYGLLPKRLKFRLLAGNRIPTDARQLVRQGEYDVIVFNDYDFLPLVKDPQVFGEKARRTHLHLDIHEYRDQRLRLVSPWRVLTAGYYRWMRSLIGDPAFTTRTTVASRLAEMYADDFGIEAPTLVRNSPPFTDLEPSPVDPDNIKLVFHGMASWARGFRDIIDALRLLDKRFSMTFMLNGSKAVIAGLADYAKDLGDRVQIVPAVPMPEISATINQYDIEIMFYQPTSPNLEFALPNKFFEAIQGRLGVVIGRSPMMAEIVERYANGVIVNGWTATDLAATIDSLDAEQIADLKDAASSAARDLNAEAEGEVFLSVLEAGRAAASQVQ